jgi:sugar O-acyltransferase (sialic acid O-acetyltransferase NeuD family)
MTPLLLVGGGGHCRSCIDVIERERRFQIAGVVDTFKDGTEILGYPVLGGDADLDRLLRDCPDALVTVGQIKSPEPRRRLYTRLKELGAQLPVVVSPGAHVSRHAQIGDGTIVMHGAVVNAAAAIGANCIVNSMALVEHDVTIGDHCHVSTGVRVNGGVVIGAGTFLGSGTVIREGARIGTGVIVGAGSVVLSDIADGAVVRGVA